jgi:hypothetical protein
MNQAFSPSTAATGPDLKRGGSVTGCGSNAATMSEIVPGMFWIRTQGFGQGLIGDDAHNDLCFPVSNPAHSMIELDIRYYYRVFPSKDRERVVGPRRSSNIRFSAPGVKPRLKAICLASPSPPAIQRQVGAADRLKPRLWDSTKKQTLELRYYARKWCCRRVRLDSHVPNFPMGCVRSSTHEFQRSHPSQCLLSRCFYSLSIATRIKSADLLACQCLDSSHLISQIPCFRMFAVPHITRDLLATL